MVAEISQRVKFSPSPSPLLPLICIGTGSVEGNIARVSLVFKSPQPESLYLIKPENLYRCGF
jgi:hypothetical protein